MELRTVIASGGSFLITLPKEFIKRHAIKAGDYLPIVGNAHLTVLPPQVDDATQEVPGPQKSI